MTVPFRSRNHSPYKITGHTARTEGAQRVETLIPKLIIKHTSESLQKHMTASFYSDLHANGSPPAVIHSHGEQIIG
eukprot:scaffold95329_cov16-Prasinocladus_malaysianus.AAC.1